MKKARNARVTAISKRISFPGLALRTTLWSGEREREGRTGRRQGEMGEGRRGGRRLVGVEGGWDRRRTDGRVDEETRTLHVGKSTRWMREEGTRDEESA